MGIVKIQRMMLAGPQVSSFSSKRRLPSARLETSPRSITRQLFSTTCCMQTSMEPSQIYRLCWYAGVELHVNGYQDRCQLTSQFRLQVCRRRQLRKIIQRVLIQVSTELWLCYLGPLILSAVGIHQISSSLHCLLGSCRKGCLKTPSGFCSWAQDRLSRLRTGMYLPFNFEELK